MKAPLRNALAWAADLLDGLVTWLSDLAGRIRGKAGEL